MRRREKVGEGVGKARERRRNRHGKARESVVRRKATSDVHRRRIRSESVQRGREQTVLRRQRGRTRINQHKRPCTIRDLRLSALRRERERRVRAVGMCEWCGLLGLCSEERRTVKQRWPTIALCWSPIMAVRGAPCNGPLRSIQPRVTVRGAYSHGAVTARTVRRQQAIVSEWR